MSRLIELRRRIKSTKNIKQITNAMEMVSAVKLKRAQELLGINKEYIKEIDHTMRILNLYRESLDEGEEKNALLVIITPTKGFVGSLVYNLDLRAKRFINENPKLDIKILGVEKKAASFIFNLNKEVISYTPKLPSSISIEDIYKISDLITAEIESKNIDSVYVEYSDFTNLITNEIKIEKIFPIDIEDDKKDEIYYTKEKDTDPPSIYSCDMKFDEMYANAIQFYIASKIFYTVIESLTTEHAVRMITMRNATDNATDLNKELILENNKERQAQITQEVIEIASSSNL
ncbi:MAG: F0F1 ATP synthase subunit gamma [Patescibacteria group bacterium]